MFTNYIYIYLICIYNHDLALNNLQWPIINIIIIMSCHQHGYTWPSLATSPYRSSPLAGLQGYIPYPHKSWRHQLYGHLPTITKTIQVRRTRHSWRSRDEHISDVLLWSSTYGQAKAGRPARLYIQWLIYHKTKINHVYIYIYKQDLALNNLQRLISHETNPNEKFLRYSFKKF